MQGLVVMKETISSCGSWWTGTSWRPESRRSLPWITGKRRLGGVPDRQQGEERVPAGKDTRFNECMIEQVSKSSLFNEVQLDTSKKEMAAMKFVAVHESKNTVDCDISNRNRSSLPHVLVRRRTIPSRQNTHWGILEIHWRRYALLDPINMLM